MSAAADDPRWTRRRWLAASSATTMSVMLAGCAGGRLRTSLPDRPAEQGPRAAPPPAGSGAAALDPTEAAGAHPSTAPAGTTTCSPLPPFAWHADELRLLEAAGERFDIVARGSAAAAVLRARARAVPAGLDLSAVEARMGRTMRAAKGVGLAAPQVGLGLRVATLVLDYKTDHPRTVFVRNPRIVERSDETLEGYEMCLSVPGIGGRVRRNRWIRIAHTSIEGELLQVEAEDHNAVLWQHELDHLDGVLYVDKVLGELLPADEIRRRRKLQERDGNAAQTPGRFEGDAIRDSSFAATDYAEGSSSFSS